MKFKLKLCWWVIVIVLLSACHEADPNPNRNLTLESFARIDSAALRIHSAQVRHELERLALADHDTTAVDFFVKRYYLKHQPMIWVDYMGLTDQADSTLAWLKTVDELGFSKRKFGVHRIYADMERLKHFSFDDSAHNISRTIARVEYHLTKGYLRYVTGQRYGFVNPHRLLNRLDAIDGKVQNGFRTLYDLPSERPTHQFYQAALRKVSTDSVAQFMREVQPNDTLYRRLYAELARGKQSPWGRHLLLVNMERRRWRTADHPELHSKYVVVNIPAYMLMAVDDSSRMEMRVGCGTWETKTPLLQSRIKRMDVNPQWILPRSIIKKTVARHAGNPAYFAAHRYFIRNRKTGKILNPATVGAGALTDGTNMVIQEGGAHNALGRIIFRFDNKFSVYLHDTSTRGVFSREDRGVSHGCVRVERPFDLGVFLLSDKNERLIQRMHYSMQADVSPVGRRRADMTEAQKAVDDTLKRRMLVGNVKLDNTVPVYIYYYTLYPDFSGSLRAYGDVYGYDAVIYNYLHNYM